MAEPVPTSPLTSRPMVPPDVLAPGSTAGEPEMKQMEADAIKALADLDVEMDTAPMEDSTMEEVG